MYDADPFAAQQRVEQRQAKNAQTQEMKSSQDSDSRKYTPSGEFSQLPEVRMASGLRDLVEKAVKTGFELYPETSDTASTLPSQEVLSSINKQLGHLGFNSRQIRDASTFLSTASPLISELFKSLSPLEASIEYLVLRVPECDLPIRFLPSNNSSNPFITSAHSGTEDLKKRWIEEKAVKEAGWPLHAIKDSTSNLEVAHNWDLLLVTLGKRLIDQEFDPSLVLDGAKPYAIDPNEYEALGAYLEDPNHIVLPLFTAPIQVHIFLAPDGDFPRPGYTPIYLTSTSIPPYIRLHLLSRLLLALEFDLQPDEGLFMAIMRILEDEWETMENNGPPDISTVLRNILPRDSNSTSDPSVVSPHPDITPSGKREKRMIGHRHHNPHENNRMKHDLEVLQASDKYAPILATRKRLPAFAARDHFLEHLESSRVVIVVGETGCGKTTQIPQFILDSLVLSNRGGEASIIVTQPRRISAISVASRVSYERLEDGCVGYAVRGESKQNKRTKLLFCTTGVVLRRLSSGDSLQNVTHVIVDEVHERSLDGDFLLLELKELLKTHPRLKVILMSATINHETFVRYFNDAPLLAIPGFTHPVKDFYLEDIVSLMSYRPSSVKQSKKTDAGDALRDELRSHGLDEETINVVQSISKTERLDYQLIAALVDHIRSTETEPGGILIFLPGVNEIRQCAEAIRKVIGQRGEVLPLHANLSNMEQQRVFKKTSLWKIIVATNVAETSITIDDVTHVIDGGKVKETRYDSESALLRLVETWVTRAAARQRRGRAGRTRPGVCYKLYTRRRETAMASFPTPEILRVPLESISLTVKATREAADVKSFLSQAIDPPSLSAMNTAWTTLQEIGAVDSDNKLTALGKHISMLPLDIRLAKILIFGTIFQCLNPILTIAACLSSKSIFVAPMDKREEAKQARARFASGRSDLLTDLEAFSQCAKMRSEGSSNHAIKLFCEENFIATDTIREVTTLRQDLLSSLVEIGFVPNDSVPTSPELNKHSENVNLLKAVIAGGLWPRVARVHLPKSAVKFDKVQAGAIQRENTANEFKFFDIGTGRVFLHPASILFSNAVWKSPFVAYFQKHMTTKVFLRDATEIPLYALLLFGGPLTVNHVAGGLTIGSKENAVKLKAWPRIGILANHLRRLLDAQLQRCMEGGTNLSSGSDNPVVHAILALLAHDGLSE